VHEIKHDGYRLIVRRDGDVVRLFTRRGHDWSGRYPAIAKAALRLRARSFTIDGEAAVCADGVAIFDALHRRGTVTEAMLYAFDLLELGMASITDRCHWASAKACWRSSWGAAIAASSTTSTRMKTAPPCSGTPASSGWRGSCRSG
jgi:hypothetical protein